MNTPRVVWPLLFSLLAHVSPGQSQGAQTNAETAGIPIALKKPGDLKFKAPLFTFARIRYTRDPSGPGEWYVDYPDADLHFSARLTEVTGLKSDPKGKVLKLTDEDLSNYPFIYLVEGGSLALSDTEVQALRSYLLGGGFLMVDDFWSESQWKHLAAQMKRVFPEREPVELDLKHPIFHSWYDLKEKPQVPNVGRGVNSQFDGITWECVDCKGANYRALLDDTGRVMAIFCHNTDLGDGWEREGNEYYFQEFSLKKAYPMGINIVVYALTH
jgi:hypothetical protein